MNKLYFGDNLRIMKELPGESVDLIYLDPPFNSKKQYNIVDDTTGEVRWFNDVWEGNFETYCEWLALRVQEMHRLLKPTGSIYLHCDPTASHYIKVKILDKIFGIKNFRNEIVWFYHDSPGRPKKDFSRKHDIIFRYTKTDEYIFDADAVRIPILEASKERYKSVRVLGGREYLGGESADKGKIPEDVWIMPVVKGNSAERVGFPTQKPLALMERIIKASSNPGDVVLDPFLGSGTTSVAAHKLERNSIGIDRSPSAIRISKQRLYEVHGEPEMIFTRKYNSKDIRNMDPNEFQDFIIEADGGVPYKKKTGDMGLDGYKTVIDGDNEYMVVYQAKRSDHIGRNPVDNFIHAMERANTIHGVFAAFSYTKGAVEEAARKRAEGIDIQLKKVDNIIDMCDPPELKLELDGNIVKAITTSEVVSFSWWIGKESPFFEGIPTRPVVPFDKKGIFDISKYSKNFNGKMVVTCMVTDIEDMEAEASIEIERS